MSYKTVKDNTKDIEEIKNTHKIEMEDMKSTIKKLEQKIVDLEKKINNIPGVVTNGIFALDHANLLLCASESEIEISEPIV